MREISVAFIEQEREIGARQENRIHRVAAHKAMCKRRELLMFLGRRLAGCGKFDVCLVNQVHFVRRGADDVNAVQRAE